MTIEESKFELRQYKLLYELKEESKQKLRELNAEFTLLNGSAIHIDGGIRDNYRDALLDEIHKQRLRTSQYIYDCETKADLIRKKLSKLKDPLGRILLKRYLEFKLTSKIAREVYLSEDRVKHLFMEALIKYSQIAS